MAAFAALIRHASLLAASATISAVLGTTPLEAQRGDIASASAAITKLEDAWAKALIKRDGATFQRLLASGFVYTENDKVMTREEVIHDVVAGTDTVKAARNEAMSVQIVGGTGIVTGWLIVSGRGKEGAFEHRYRFTDTWVKRGSDWQIVAAQDYLMPGKK